MKKIVLTRTEQDYIKEHLLKKESLTKIAKDLGYGVDLISREAKLIMGLTFDFKRKSYINLDYFENIDTQEKAYWLGFLAADGYICNTELNIQLQENDKLHLKKFSDAIQGNLTIRDTNSKNNFGTPFHHYRVSVESKKLVEDLGKYGIVQNKSLKLKPPDLPEILIPYWILGYMDGNGNIQKNKKKFRMNFTGTYDIISFIKEYLHSNNTISLEHRCKSTYKIQLENNLSMDFLKKYDYCSLPFCLERKKRLVSLYSSDIQ